MLELARSPARQFGILTGLLLLVTAAPLAAQELKFSGEFSDGARVKDKPLKDWHTAPAQAKLDDRPLFDVANPIRWFRNEKVALPAVPSACVEMFGGDRLPGRVVGAEETTAGPVEPTQLLIVPDFEFNSPGVPPDLRRSRLKVQSRWIRRIVWERRKSEQYSPNTLFYRDGRQTAFRSARFTEQSVSLLTDSGRQSINYGDIAEIHFPKQNSWDAWLDQLAILSPQLSGRLFQLETASGLRLTTSLERSTMLGGGTSNAWWHRVQPAWLLEPICLPLPTVAVERFFAATEVPLNGLEPSRVVQRAMLSGNWRVQTDRALLGGALECGEAGQSFAWGYGVHAYTEMAFDLPPATKSFRTRFGLDRSVGRGGCVRALVYVNEITGEPRFDSQFVVGSEKVVDTGEIALADLKAGPNSLVLVVDPAHDGRPAGADPLDIRDVANWCQPLLTLDDGWLQSEVRNRLPRLAPGWEGWTLAAGDAAELTWINRWEVSDNSYAIGHYATIGAPSKNFVTWSKSLRVGMDDRYLMIYSSRARGSGHVLNPLQLRINGRPAMEIAVQQRSDTGESVPVVFPVEQYRGRDIDLQLVQMGGERFPFEFGSVRSGKQIPGLCEVFQDQQPDDAHWSSEGAVSLDANDVYAGKRAIKVAAGGKVSIKLDNLAIRERPALGEYRMLRFAWKQVKGKQMSLRLPHETKLLVEGEPPIFQYLTGAQNVPRKGDRVHRLAEKSPTEWLEVSRDLYGDYGTMTLQGLEFSVADGDYALLDHIYLGRRWDDFEHCPKNASLIKGGPESDPNVVRVGTRPGEYTDVLADFAPQFSTAASGWSGVAILKKFAERENVLRTDPGVESKKCTLRAPLKIPADKSTKLNLSVNHLPNCDWQLEVAANGQSLLQRTIEPNATKGQWLDMSVDLTKFAGQKVLLELHNKMHGAENNDFGYWSKIEIVSE